ncbi:VOC family protein [Rufibacter psychrotolerans]|uniref:VOC family protein n=1 Tax=Rufibacter psychrotolerans TaxID=2812556 RepID=UPI001F075384|nr:VOC family protein [Rufibacter sp. SYSU D00308]
MALALNQVTVSVQQVPDAVAYYLGLGLHLIVQSPHYARFVCPDGLSTFSVHLHEGPVPASGTTVYFETDHLDQRVASLKAQGYVFEQDPKDQPWEWREAYLRDPSGNRICLYHAGETRVNPAWRLPESRQQYYLTPVRFTAWLEAMQTALSENNAAALQQLFSVDVRLLESPFAAPVFGAAKIKQHWDNVMGLFANVSYTLVGVQGEIGYAQLEGTWGSTDTVVYSAMLALKFNPAGLCTEIVVWGGPTLSRAVMMKNVSGVFHKNQA